MTLNLLNFRIAEVIAVLQDAQGTDYEGEMINGIQVAIELLKRFTLIPSKESSMKKISQEEIEFDKVRFFTQLKEANYNMKKLYWDKMDKRLEEAKMIAFNLKEKIEKGIDEE